MKQLTAVFDVQGLMYPHLKSSIITPLEERGVAVQFWSLGSYSTVTSLLHKAELDSYAAHAITGEATEELYSALEHSIQNGFTDFLRAWLTMYQVQHVDTNQAIVRGKALLESRWKYGINLKFPPMLTDGPAILVESDSAYFFKKEIHVEQPFIDGYRAVGKDNNFSVVFMPEERIWNEAGLVRRPEEAESRLSTILKEWDGSLQFHVVSQYLRIYEEGQPRRQKER